MSVFVDGVEYATVVAAREALLGRDPLRLQVYGTYSGDIHVFSNVERAPMGELHDCGDCGAKPGELHQPGCDVERCANCGWQAIGCDCIYEVCGIDHETLEETHPEIWNKGTTNEMEERFDKYIESIGGRLPWTGEWPGTAECREYGWWQKWVIVDASVDPPRGQWVDCAADDPDAGPALNRLHTGCVWDRKARRFVRPGAAA